MAINEWWAGDPAQKYWMEITNRLDLGGPLKAPQVADDGRPKWGYELVRFVRPGDIVLHWHARGERMLAGFSVVAGPPESKAMTWQSRGTSGRASPSPIVDEPAWIAPLKGLTRFPAPLTRQGLQSLRGAVLDTRNRLAEAHGRDALYFPFYEYGHRELRATQSYLAKFPAELIPVLGLAIPDAPPEASRAASPAATLAGVLDAIRGLRMQEGPDGLPKRHQPLALLWAIGRARQGDRLSPWPLAGAQISELIGRFGRPADQRNPNLPFLALGRTDLWEISPEPPEGTEQQTLREWLRKTSPHGGLSESVSRLVTTDADAAARVVAWLLDAYFADVDADSLLEDTGLSDLTGQIRNMADQEAARDLIDALNRDSAVIAAEDSRAGSTTYERANGTVTVIRGEARLVARYLETLSPDKATRLRLAVGLTDLYDTETADIIEAKVSADHRYVRQALGQLLDYAAHCAQPLSQLTALFPARPARSDIRLLHLYGIDCLYWVGGTAFNRDKAPAEARERIRAAWSTTI